MDPPRESITPSPQINRLTSPPSSPSADLFVNGPWVFDDEFMKDPNWVTKANGIYSSFKLLDDSGRVHDPKTFEIVKTLWNDYFHGASFTIKEAYAIINPNLKSLFETNMFKLKRRIESSPELFHVDDYKSKGELEWRQWVLETLHSRFAFFKHNTTIQPKILPFVHGLRNPNAAWNICQVGLAALSTLDNGYYGSGVYFTSFAEYAVKHYTTADSNGSRAVILSWVTIGNAYPVVEEPGIASPLTGRPLRSGYDAHYCLVKPNGSSLLIC